MRGRADMYTTIEITFMNGQVIKIPQDCWDDYDISDGFIIIKKNNAWVALYKASEIFSLILKKEGDSNSKLS